MVTSQKNADNFETKHKTILLKQNKTKRNETKQNKTKQNKTKN